MCLRYTLTRLALTQRTPVVTRRAKPTLELMHFDLTLPARVPGERPLLVGNTRSETLLTRRRSPGCADQCPRG